MFAIVDLVIQNWTMTFYVKRVADAEAAHIYIDKLMKCVPIEDYFIYDGERDCIEDFLHPEKVWHLLPFCSDNDDLLSRFSRATKELNATGDELKVTLPRSDRI